MVAAGADACLVRRGGSGGLHSGTAMPKMVNYIA